MATETTALPILTAKVLHVEPTRPGKAKVVTQVEIVAGPLKIASGTLGHKWSEKQALQEFRTHRHRFTKDQDYDAAKALSII